MPEVLLCRFFHGRWEVLLQRRSDNHEWSFPGGKDDPPERDFVFKRANVKEGKRPELDRKLPPEVLERGALRAAFRELIEEACGPAGDRVGQEKFESDYSLPEIRYDEKTLKEHHFYADKAAKKRKETTPVCVPPTVQEVMGCQNPNIHKRYLQVTGPRPKVVRGKEGQFVATFLVALDLHVADRGWEEWRPRALPGCRKEIDERPARGEFYGEKRGDFMHGYIWVPLQNVLDCREFPVPESKKPTSRIALKTFQTYREDHQNPKNRVPTGEWKRENMRKIVRFLKNLETPAQRLCGEYVSLNDGRTMSIRDCLSSAAEVSVSLDNGERHNMKLIYDELQGRWGIAVDWRKIIPNAQGALNDGRAFAPFFPSPENDMILIENGNPRLAWLKQQETLFCP
uniref:Nudix hydrolase domain-containing protein n=1 Tax=Chromera velia CCMP2878 TaxID=1169474 RepID=A0A0G4I5X5_9ALVE|eukprot:Cvel_11256.t1-p1 / transcript=Cvel_11256.t1 / gene=Cvel_11256 / organism=Chromera_velia_CCMP2878 / gene_product=hypothetical protein / transcript_product=hypothetical protein / location=Cvel_scaffold702:1616-3369(-) / protein_length=398 / sequence_SO=supercontig / SO=protein_coding / is_pseudo=false